MGRCSICNLIIYSVDFSLYFRGCKCCRAEIRCTNILNVGADICQLISFLNPLIFIRDTMVVCNRGVTIIEFCNIILQIINSASKTIYRI